MVYNVTKKTFPSGIIQYKFYNKKIIVGVTSNNPCSKSPDELLSENKTRTIESLKNSMKRSKTNIYDIARCVKWDYFITLTLNPDLVDRFNYNSACDTIKLFTKWCRRNGLLYLLVPEQHKNGAWHFHGLVFCDNKNVYQKMLVDSGHKSKQNIIYNIKSFKYGFTTATAILDTQRVSSYISKYITKAFSVPKCKKRYWCSQKIERPKETWYLVTDDELENVINYNADYSKVIFNKFSDTEVRLYELHRIKS